LGRSKKTAKSRPRSFRDEILSIGRRVSACDKSSTLRSIKRLLAAGVSSFDDLERLLAHGTESQKSLACWVLSRTGRKKYARALMAALKDEKASSGLVAEAGTGLCVLRSKTCLKPIIRVLRRGATADHRQAAAYALRGYQGREACLALAEKVADKREDEEVRGCAAESLGEVACMEKKGTRLYEHSGKVLLNALKDPSCVLLFWAAFAISSMGYRKALPELRNLARSDRRLVPGLWYVHEEARDTIACLEGRMPRDRVPVHMRGKGRGKGQSACSRGSCKVQELDR
jgi:HEAT repeat protein